ncbi:glycosyltransferase family 4 protein [Providencia sp. PROV037]|nr:glycosyltransferase family 4 protein [Providencia sp. PROV037]
MKIVYVITKADEIGGAQTHVRDLAIYFRNDGHHITVIVGEEGIFTKQLRENNIDTIILSELKRNISPINDLFCAIKLRKLIKSLTPDIVTLHSSKAGIIGRLSLIFTSIPVIFTAHGWAFTDGIPKTKKYIFVFIEKLFSNFADKIITVSEKDKKLALRYKVASEKKQVVIHNGISDIDIFKNPNSSPNSSPIKLISVARFSKQKDHITLFQSLKELNNNWHLSLIGKGPLLNQMIELAKKLNLDSNITFYGEREDVAELLSQSDIFILSTNWEGLPISIIEVMRAGLPIISTDVGGVNELIFDGINGYLIRPKDNSHLTEKINELINSKSKREEYGSASRALFLKKFHINNMYTKTKNTFDKILQEKNKC